MYNRVLYSLEELNTLKAIKYRDLYIDYTSSNKDTIEFLNSLVNKN
jgi:GT2 family glycosyltransferase